MSEGRTEGEILKQACQGDESAFLIIYKSHRDCVFRFAYRMLGSAAAAEDITHDCFLSLLQKPHLFDPGRASLRTYLCAAARNMAWKHLRLRGIETESWDTDEIKEPVQRDGPYEHICSSEVAHGVRQAIDSLPPLQREAIILFELEGLSLSDTAAIAETDPGTIKSRLHRARHRLRGLLSKWIISGESGVTEETKA